VAAVDVYEQEPLRDTGDPLLTMDNVVCTPHIGYVSRGSYEIYYREAVEDIAAWLRGEPVRVLG